MKTQKIKKWQKFTKDDIEKIVKDSNSYKEVAEKLGYSGADKNSKAREAIAELGIDASHLNNNAKKGTFDYSRFVYGKELKGSDSLNAIAALRGRACECCGLTEWMKRPIALEIHHIDGDRLNNNLDNLQLLCLNCHALTPNWKRRKVHISECVSDDEIVSSIIKNKNSSIRQILKDVGLSDCGSNYKRIRKIADKLGVVLPQIEQKINYCVDCGKVISSNAERCIDCNNKFIIQNWFSSHNIDRDDLKDMIRKGTFKQIGEKFNVSDSTIKKWCKKFELPYKKADINSYSDEEWDLV